jgi:hypothetical protein
MYCVDLAENAPFKSSGVICWSPPPSSLPEELSMNKRDSNRFFSTRRLCMARDRSNNMTGSSLIVAHWQIPYSGKFSLVQNFAELHISPSEEIFEVFIFAPFHVETTPTPIICM